MAAIVCSRQCVIPKLLFQRCSYAFDCDGLFVCDGKNAVTVQSRPAVTVLFIDNESVNLCLVTDDSNLPNIFFCVALVSGFFFDSFVTEYLFYVGLFFGHQSAFSAVEPVISRFTVVAD